MSSSLLLSAMPNNESSELESSVSSITTKLVDTRSLYLRGKVEFNNSNYDEACDIFKEVAQLQEGLLGKYHKDTVKTYWRLGKCYCYSGNKSSSQKNDALIAFQRSTRMANSALGSTTSKLLRQDIESCWKLCFPSLPNSINDMYTIFIAEQDGDMLYKSRDYKSASESYIKALDIQSSLFNNNNNNNNESSLNNTSSSSLDAADIRMKLGQCYIQISNLNDAEIVLKESHDCYVKLVGKDHPATYSSIASMKKLKTLSGRSLVGGGTTNNNMLSSSSKFGWLRSSSPQSSLSSLGGSSTRTSSGSNNNGNGNGNGNGGPTPTTTTTKTTTTSTPTSSTTTTTPIIMAASASSE